MTALKVFWHSVDGYKRHRDYLEKDDFVALYIRIRKAVLPTSHRGGGGGGVIGGVIGGVVGERDPGGEFDTEEALYLADETFRLLATKSKQKSDSYAHDILYAANAEREEGEGGLLSAGGGCPFVDFPTFAEYIFELVDCFLLDRATGGNATGGESEMRDESWLQPDVYSYMIGQLQATILCPMYSWIDHFEANSHGGEWTEEALPLWREALQSPYPPGLAADRQTHRGRAPERDAERSFGRIWAMVVRQVQEVGPPALAGLAGGAMHAILESLFLSSSDIPEGVKSAADGYIELLGSLQADLRLAVEASQEGRYWRRVNEVCPYAMWWCVAGYIEMSLVQAKTRREPVMKLGMISAIFQDQERAEEESASHGHIDSVPMGHPTLRQVKQDLWKDCPVRRGVPLRGVPRGDGRELHRYMDQFGRKVEDVETAFHWKEAEREAKRRESRRNRIDFRGSVLPWARVGHENTPWEIRRGKFRRAAETLSSRKDCMNSRHARHRIDLQRSTMCHAKEFAQPRDPGPSLLAVPLPSRRRQSPPQPSRHAVPTKPSGSSTHRAVPRPPRLIMRPSVPRPPEESADQEERRRRREKRVGYSTQRSPPQSSRGLKDSGEWRFGPPLPELPRQFIGHDEDLPSPRLRFQSIMSPWRGGSVTPSASEFGDSRNDSHRRMRLPSPDARDWA